MTTAEAEPSVTPSEPRNAFGITSLVLAIIGMGVAFIPFGGIVAAILGVPAAAWPPTRR